MKFYIHLIYFALIIVILPKICVGQSDVNQLLPSSKGKYVTYSSNTSFCDFLDYVEFLYTKYDKKNLKISTNCSFPIGIELTNVFYKNALKEICETNNLKLVEKANTVSISKVNNREFQVYERESLLDNRQVKITAILFEANLDKMKEQGVDWNYIISKHGMEGTGGFSSNSVGKGNFGIRTAGDFGKFAGYTSAVLNFLESENLGKIVSKMTVIVNDKEKSKMQVGSDISIKQLDFAGNVTDAFFPTGTIINVEPKVIISDTLEITKLKIHVERSSSYSNENKEISRTYTDTEVLLRNKEEMIIGSLLLDEEIILREGIPVLKDLPWWVLGLRYLTGYNSKIVVHKEVVILVSAELLPLIAERYNENNDLIRNRIKNDSEEINNLIKGNNED